MTTDTSTRTAWLNLLHCMNLTVDCNNNLLIDFKGGSESEFLGCKYYQIVETDSDELTVYPMVENEDYLVDEDEPEYIEANSVYNFCAVFTSNDEEHDLTYNDVIRYIEAKNKKAVFV